MGDRQTARQPFRQLAGVDGSARLDLIHLWRPYANQLDLAARATNQALPATMPPSPRRVGSSPAATAAPFGSAVWMSTPEEILKALAMGSGAGWKPSEARCTAPYWMSCGTTRRTVLEGMAKPRPAEVPVLVKMAVLTPISNPDKSSSGPPLLPASGMGRAAGRTAKGTSARSGWVSACMHVSSCLCCYLRKLPHTKSSSTRTGSHSHCDHRKQSWHTWVHSCVCLNTAANCCSCLALQVARG
jgi:hypothetical protein